MLPVRGHVVSRYPRRALFITREKKPGLRDFETCCRIDLGCHHLIAVAPEQLASIRRPRHFAAAFGGDLPPALNGREGRDVDLKQSALIRDERHPATVGRDAGPPLPERATAEGFRLAFFWNGSVQISPLLVGGAKSMNSRVWPSWVQELAPWPFGLARTRSACPLPSASCIYMFHRVRLCSN